MVHFGFRFVAFGYFLSSVVLLFVTPLFSGSGHDALWSNERQRLNLVGWECSEEVNKSKTEILIHDIHKKFGAEFGLVHKFSARVSIRKRMTKPNGTSVHVKPWKSGHSHGNKRESDIVSFSLPLDNMNLHWPDKSTFNKQFWT